MGLIYGAYDAKADGFSPGGASLHNCMAGHGPDVATWQRAVEVELVPHKVEHALAFMFETRWIVRPTPWALEHASLQQDYDQAWSGFPRLFAKASAR
jgi:homogentisate 1,2-dioxygenase